MYYAWLFAFCIAFIVFAATFFCARADFIYEEYKKTLYKILGEICAILAMASLLFFCITAIFGTETGVVKEESPVVKTVFLVSIAPEGKNEYLVEDGDQYVYFYRDFDGELQVGHADREKSKICPGNLNGDACVLITTTYYDCETKWFVFTADKRKSSQSFCFYTP